MLVEAVSLDYPAPRRRQPQHLAQPIGDDFLDLRHRRAGLPGQPEHAEAGADQIAQHARQQRVSGKIPEEARVLPQRQAGHHQPVQNRRSPPRILPPCAGGATGRASRISPGRVAAITGRIRQAFMIIGQPVDQLVAITAKVVRGHAPVSLAAVPD